MCLSLLFPLSHHPWIYTNRSRLELGGGVCGQIKDSQWRRRMCQNRRRWEDLELWSEQASKARVAAVHVLFGLQKHDLD
jgi:hypothetical protein